MASPWESMQVSYLLESARVVATLKDGGAVVEEGLTLSMAEGRRETYSRQGEGRPLLPSLEYGLGFGIANAPVPMTGESVEARIVVEGTHSGNGLRLEIRGDGWLGYDENGSLEGHFDEPPVMIIDEVEDEAREASNQTDISAADIRVVEPRPSPQFARALTGRVRDQHE